MSTTTPVSKRMERGILGLFVTAAAVVAFLFVLPAIRQIGSILAGETPVDLLTRVDIPHTSASSPNIVGATFDTAWVIASGLSDGAQWLIAAGIGFGALTAAATAGAVAYFILLLMWKRPFHRSLVAATQLAGGALLIGGMLAAGLGGLARMMAASELNPIAEDAFIVGFRFDPAVLLAGLAVLTLSVVFQRGLSLQRDTEGLV